MAYRNKLEVEKSLVWNTEIPYESNPRRSSNFSLMGSEWYLEFSYKKGDLFHVLSLYGATVGDGPGPQQREFKARTHITNPTPLYDFQSNEIAVRIATVSRTDTMLWNAGNNNEEIFRIYPLLYRDRICEIQFVCRFYGQPPSAFQLEIGSGNLGEKKGHKSSEIPRDLESLSSDFSHLLEKEILPDVKLECGGRTLQAHRSVLAARSLVFRAMFQNEMLESETGAVKIQDMDVAVLEKLLKFIYTGKQEDISESTAADLYEAADKYDVHSLKTACAYWIERNLSVENCVKYLVVADSHSDREFKAAVVKFILENPSLLKSEAWITFSKERPLLANEVLLAYIASTVQ